MKESIPALDEAVALHKMGKMTQAEKKYLEVIDGDFDNTDALYLLGTIYLQQKCYGLGAQLLMRRLDLDSNHFESWNNLGNAFKASNKDTDAEYCYGRALKVTGRPAEDYADVYNNLATLHINGGSQEEGLRLARKALEYQPDHADANWNLSLLLLETGSLGEGFDLYKYGFDTKIRLHRDYGMNLPTWDGKKKQRVIVWGEQGIGDEILFASMLPELAKLSREVVFDCHPRLLTLFKESFPNMTIYGTRKDDYISWPHDHKNADAKIAIGDIAKFLRRDIKDFPAENKYLKANPERVEHYKAKLAKLGNKRPKIGISWTGGYAKTRSDYRSIDLKLWAPILEQNADFISLQYTPDAYRAVAEIEDKLDVRVHHWPSAVGGQDCPDYAETAALVESLDLIITVNTATHHLAGALGKECWTLTPQSHAWRYWSKDEDGSTIPWYPSCKQFLQKELLNWTPVISDVAMALEVRIKGFITKGIKTYKEYTQSIKASKEKKS